MSDIKDEKPINTDKLLEAEPHVDSLISRLEVLRSELEDETPIKTPSEIQRDDQRALRKLLSKNHGEAMKGRAGGAVMCVCGQGCGGTPECSAYKSLLNKSDRVDDLLSDLASAHEQIHQQEARIERLEAEVEKYEADKVMLEDLHKVFPPRFGPDYEKGWNDAITFAIEKFGRNAWVQEREEMLDEALQDEGTITRLNDQLSAITAERDRYKTALEQIVDSRRLESYYVSCDIAVTALGETNNGK